MTKTKRIKPKKGIQIKNEQLPLADQIISDCVASSSGRVKTKAEKDSNEGIGGSLGHSIVQQSLAQLRDIQKECNDEEWPPLDKHYNWREAKRNEKKSVFTKPSIKADSASEEEDSDDGTVDEFEKATPVGVDRIVGDFEKELDIDSKDLEILKHFDQDSHQPQKTLADLFRDKITEKQTEIQSQVDANSVCSVNLSPQVQEMCKEVGKVLSCYKSGPLPKMFKVIPKMRAWEELVYLTEPEKWSSAAMYQATRIFVSNLKESMAQRFFNLVLLPRVRDDISDYKRLNFHIYQALFKALFKPGAFFKGILLPLCMSGNCTLREAIIIGSVVAKNHIPMMHTAAAMHKIAEMNYTGPSSIFLRIFFDKKYALPYRVIDACVYHFLKFEYDSRTLPVLWHQALLVFVQRYKEDLSQDQKDALMKLLRVQQHPKITPEVRRELQNSKCREESEPMNVD